MLKVENVDEQVMLGQLEPLGVCEILALSLSASSSCSPRTPGPKFLARKTLMSAQDRRADAEPSDNLQTLLTSTILSNPATSQVLTAEHRSWLFQAGLQDSRHRESIHARALVWLVALSRAALALPLHECHRVGRFSFCSIPCFEENLRDWGAFF